MTFLHSADWHIGKPFTAFGDAGEGLRQTRVDTLRRALELGRAEAVDFFIIAGDLFEDHQIARQWIDAVYDLFERYCDFPIVVAPGNHDPSGGPETIWRREPFAQPPEHVHIIHETKRLEFDAANLVVSPLFQKRSSEDPSRRLEPHIEVIGDDERPIIGVTHGALNLLGEAVANDHPINPEAASNLGLDYLALGHWHNGSEVDEGRVVMPGTPEPDSFGLSAAGDVVLVSIHQRGDIPKTRRHRIAALEWIHERMDVGDPEELTSRLHGWSEGLANSVVRVTLDGFAEAEALRGIRERVDHSIERAFARQVVDQSSPRLSDRALERLALERPLLAELIDELDGMEAALLGAESHSAQRAKPMGLAEMESIAQSLRLSLSDMDADFFKAARRRLYADLQESLQ